MKKYTVTQLLRRACIYAERERELYLDSVRGVKDYEEDYKEELEFLNQLKEYRRGRWGKTGEEKFLETVTPIVINSQNNP
jgi:hypothetical protein